MGYRCAVEVCRNFCFKTRANDKSIKYHSFPKNSDLRKKWINVCRRAEKWVPDNSSYICSEHFLPSDYERDLKAELLNLPPKKILKPQAIPSLNLIKTATEEDKIQYRKKKNCETNIENKENNVKITESNNLFNGFIISYLGVPRLLITAPNNIQSNGNQSKIIPLEHLETIENKTYYLPEQDSTASGTAALTLNRNVFKLDELCRLCGSYSNRMKSIFDDKEFNFLELIHNNFPDIKVCKNDVLPILICSRCENNLISWNHFYRTCNTINRRFQSILKKLSIKTNEKLINESPDNTDKMLRSYIKEDVNNDNDYYNDDLDIKEIEIVEVKPEATDYDIETAYLDEKISMENTYDLLEENLGISDCENFAMNDALQETVELSPRLSKLKKDMKNSSNRRKRKRRHATLNLRRMCHMCGKIFKYPESLRRHLKTVHSDERPFKCHLCTSSFNRNHNLTIHIKVVHQRQRVYVKKHVPRLCDYCGKVLLSARSLEEHISSIHTKKALYECEKCHSTFYRKLTYDKHKSSNECDSKNPRKCNAPKVEEDFLKFCEFCGLEFKKEHFYIKHKFKHMNSFICSICSGKFDNGNLLKDHMDSEHPEVKPFECNRCGKKFKNKSLLNCHLAIHTGEKRYECERCSMKFLKKKYLSTHILTHTGERPFVCSICNKGFKQSGDMRKHKATHIRNRRQI